MKRKIIAVDMFCGAGGTSTGLLQACEELGAEVELVAINHWEPAIATHSKNHPNVHHICQSVEQIDPLQVIPGGRVDLLVASPECRHHSTARGGRPIHDQKRASAWYILRWAELLWIENILIENVPEFQKWGPLNRRGKRIKSREGELYQAFLQALRGLGYTLEFKILNHADYGDATTRRRLFIIARKGLKSIVWPRKTYSPEKHRPAFKVIDWNLPGESIFNRKKKLAAKTIERIAAGLEKFAGPWAEPFLTILRGTGKARSIHRPIPSLTTGSGKGGGHVALCEPMILAHRQFKNDCVDSIRKPMRTITGHGRDWAIAQPFLVNTEHHGGNGKYVRGLKDPLYTISTKPGIGVAMPFIVPNFGEKKGQKPRTHSVGKPMPAATSHGAGGLAFPIIITPGGPDLRKGSSVKDPLPTVTCKDRFGLATPFIVNMKGRSKARSVRDPLPAQTTRKHVYMAVPFVLPRKGYYHSTGNVPRSINKPLPTATSRGAGYVVYPYMIEVNHGKNDVKKGSIGRRAASVQKPLRTITTRNGWALIAPMLVKYYGSGIAKRVTEPVDTLTTKARMGLAMPLAKGCYVIDILFRMLQPHELAAAMSFPKGYQFIGKKEDVVKQIGNAVGVRTARALCRSILRNNIWWLRGKKRIG